MRAIQNQRFSGHKLLTPHVDLSGVKEALTVISAKMCLNVDIFGQYCQYVVKISAENEIGDIFLPTFTFEFLLSWKTQCLAFSIFHNIFNI